MHVTIRNARPEDMQAVRQLIVELAVFEREPEAVEVTVDMLKHDAFGTDPVFTCFVAEADNAVVGTAIVYDRYSTWKGRILHLEDLIVTEQYRGNGIGGLLLDQVVRYGFERAVKRISWNVLDWNEEAITFYESKGARVLRDWDVVHLDENGIHNYMKQLE